MVDFTCGRCYFAWFHFIIFIVGIGIETECQKIKLQLRTKLLLVVLSICAIVVFIFGYFLATLSLCNLSFYICLLFLIVVSFIGANILIHIFQHSSPNDIVIKPLDNEEENRRIMQMLESEDKNKSNLVKGMTCLGGAMFTFVIMYLVIPILVRRTTIKLTYLYELGGTFYVIFTYLNWKKYILFYKEINKTQYFVETGMILIGMVSMYYVDGYIYRGESITNILLDIMYAFCVIPFIISTKKISTEFFIKLSKEN